MGRKIQAIRYPKYLQTDEGVYFGEVKNNNIPTGCGLYTTSTSFMMHEDRTNNVGNGMFIYRDNDDETMSSIGIESNSQTNGPCLFIEDFKSITFIQNVTNTRNGFAIRVNKDGTYQISKFYSDLFIKKIITFNNGDFKLSYGPSFKGKGELFKKIKCGKEFKFDYSPIRIDHFCLTTHITPAFMKRDYSEGSDVYFTALGGVQSYGDDIDFYRTYKGEIKYNRGSGYGFLPYLDKAFYMGDFYEGKRHGVGCLRNSDALYLGQFYNDKLSGPVMTIYNDGACLSIYKEDLIEGTSFDVFNNVLSIIRYKNSKPYGDYYQIDINLLKIKKFNPNHQLIEEIDFPHPDLDEQTKERWNNEEKERKEREYRIALREKRRKKEHGHKKRIKYTLNKKHLKQLENFEWMYDEKMQFTLTKVKELDIYDLTLPLPIARIKEYAFKEQYLNTLSFTSLCDLFDEYALWDLNFSTLDLSKSDITNLPYCLTNSQRLKELYIPNHVTYVEEYAFYYSGLRKVSVNRKTVINKNSFPKGCVIEYREDSKTPKKKKKAKKERKENPIFSFFKSIKQKFKDRKIEKKLRKQDSWGTPKKKKSFSLPSIELRIGLATIIILILFAVSLFFMIAAITGLMSTIVDSTCGILKWPEVFNLEFYNWFFFHLAGRLYVLDMEVFVKVILFIFFLIASLLAIVIDIIAYVVMFLLIALAYILTYLIYSLIFIGTPLICLIVSVILFIKTKDEDYNKIIPIIAMILILATCVVYYILAFGPLIGAFAR